MTKVNTEDERNLPRKRRLRKKLHVGEFKEFATEIKCTGFDKLCGDEVTQEEDWFFETIVEHSIELTWMSASDEEGIIFIEGCDESHIGIIKDMLHKIGAKVTNVRTFDAHYDIP